MTCKQTCPQGFYKQEVECANICSQNYYLFNGIYTNKIPLGQYINNNTPNPCPQVCKTCTDQSTCSACVGNYPKYGKCPYFLDVTTNTCVFQCQSSDLVYQTLNLYVSRINVGQFKRINQYKPFSIKQYKQCAQPCVEGYYTDYGVLKCIKCKSPCFVKMLKTFAQLAYKIIFSI